MGLSRTIRFAAAAVSISLVAGPAAIAAPPPSAAAPTAAQIQSIGQTPADLAATLAAQRQLLAQQTAQRHQAQLQAIKPVLAAGVQPMVGARLGAQSLPLVAAPTRTIMAVGRPPAIAIRQLSAAEGDPGTPILLTGDGFGDSSGEVHFIVANGRDLKAAVSSWSNSQVMAEVPYLDGVSAFDGSVYVQHSDGRKSAGNGFRFRPPLDVAVLGMPPCVTGAHFCAAYSDSVMSAGGDSYFYENYAVRASMVASFNGIDNFYNSAQLKNGWTVVSCGSEVATPVSHGHYSVANTDCRVGTSSPFVKLRWWIDWGVNRVAYAPRVVITGPKGLPYF
jgi:hypothetical protein